MKDTKNFPERQTTSSSQAAGSENIEPPVRGPNQPASPRQRKLIILAKFRLIFGYFWYFDVYNNYKWVYFTARSDTQDPDGNEIWAGNKVVKVR